MKTSVLLSGNLHFFLLLLTTVYEFKLIHVLIYHLIQCGGHKGIPGLFWFFFF